MDGTIELGDVPWREIPGYLALADAFVQPGAPDDFNRYRLPSKLPEFLAIGRPVVLPACNLGNELVDGKDALLLREGDALEIVARLEQLLDDRELAARLGSAPRHSRFDRLNWTRNAAAAGRLLPRAAGGRPRAGARVSATARRAVRARRCSPTSGSGRSSSATAALRGRPLSYGTVRDLADSRDNLVGLARANADMKDLQRCWMVKAVLGMRRAGRPPRGDRRRRAAGRGPARAARVRGHCRRSLRRKRRRAAASSSSSARAYPEVDLRPGALPADAPASPDVAASTRSRCWSTSRSIRGRRRRRCLEALADAGRLRHPRDRPRRRGLGRGRAPGAPRGDRPAVRASRTTGSTTLDRQLEATRRRTSSPQRPTSAGGGTSLRRLSDAPHRLDRPAQPPCRDS